MMFSNICRSKFFALCCCLFTLTLFTSPPLAHAGVNCAMPASGVTESGGATYNDIIAAQAAAGGYSPGDFGGASVVLDSESFGVVLTCQGNNLIASYFGPYGTVEYADSMSMCNKAMPTCSVPGYPCTVDTGGHWLGSDECTAVCTNTYEAALVKINPTTQALWTLSGGPPLAYPTAIPAGCGSTCSGRPIRKSSMGYMGQLPACGGGSPVNGACGGSAATCSAGTVSGDNGQTACGTTRSWTCSGSGGGSNASCSVSNGACSVNGVCGSANGTTVSSAPSSNLCSTGTASAVSGSGPWSWTCSGANGGSNASCSANKTASGGWSDNVSGGPCYGGQPSCSSVGAVTGGPCTGGMWCYNGPSCGSSTQRYCTTGSAVNGACGGSPGTCTAGTLTGDNGQTSCGTTRSWSCAGSGGGTTASCSVSNAACAVNGVCGGSGACSSGSVSGDNGLTSCGTTRTWTCNGSGGGSNASCSYSNAACAVNGVCGGSGACSSGSVSGDNGQTSCGTTRTWTCNGSGGGSNASCSYSNALCAVNGTCGTANGGNYYSAPSTNLCSAGSATAVGGTGPFTWNCNGANGGTNASCSANKSTDGACGSSNGANFYAPPSTNLCNAGTASAVAGTGPYTWTCTGTNGGTTASCSASKSTDGVCGSSNGVGVTSAPSSNLCSAGTATPVSGAGPWSWNCTGVNGGTTASCSAPLRVDGVCGSANGVGAYSAPSSGLCSAGSASSVSGSGPFTWTCNGSNGGTTASCSAPLRQDAVCGSSNGANFYTAPSTNLCSVGSPSAVGGSGPFTWTCTGVNGGNNASCSANKSVNGVCGTANGVSTETSPSSGLCSAGNPTAVSNSSNTWSWSCNGIYGGTTAGCSAPQKINGTCGPANGSSVYTAPSSGLCGTGNATTVVGAGPYDWNCNGINGGTNASCTAYQVVNGACGPANGQFSASPPTSGLCSAGTGSAVTGTGPYSWTCAGVNGGTVASCNSQAIVNGSCGPANNTPTAGAPAAGLCATGTAGAVTGTGPWGWTCNGSGGGTNSNCTAPTPPPPPSFGGACPS